MLCRLSYWESCGRPHRRISTEKPVPYAALYFHVAVVGPMSCLSGRVVPVAGRSPQMAGATGRGNPFVSLVLRNCGQYEN